MRENLEGHVLFPDTESAQFIYMYLDNNFWREKLIFVIKFWHFFSRVQRVTEILSKFGNEFSIC